MSDEVFSTILAYTKSPKVTKRTTFQDELIKAITARSARQRSSEYSDDFDSDEIVSLGDFSDTSVDENSNKKKMNDFHISDDEEKNSPKLSFLKTKKSNSDIMKDEPVFSTKNDEEMAPDGCGNMVGTPLSESQNNDQEIEKDKIKMKPKPRILPVKSMSSENNSSPEANNHFKPSPRPRSMLKKHSHGEEKDGLEEGKTSALREELEARSAPSPLPKLNDGQLEAEKKLASENLDPKDPWLTSLSSSSLKENLGDSFSPGSGGKASVEDQNEELTENHNSLKSNENEGNSFLIDFVTTPIEKSQESQVITDDLEEEKEKAELIMNDLTVDPLFKSQSILISTDTTESSKKTVEDRNMKNKKSTNNRASSASGRLMTSEFLKKSSSIRRPPSTTTSSHYLGTLKVLDQKPSQKQNIEPEKADSIRAAVYQEWLEKKNVYLHEMHRIKRIESENLRIQNEQKRAAKREEALASFEAWKAMKEKEAKKIAAQRRLEEKNKKKTEEENAARKGEALQAFERWKEKKMEYLREKNKKEREYERAKKQKEEETIAEKRKDNLTAIEKWNERKDAFFKEKEKEKINEKRREELKRAEKKDKDKQAIDEYEKWLEKKERQERIERKQKKRHSFLENEALPPWSPPSRTVFSRKTVEDRNMKNKKSTNNRASSASGRLMTPEVLKISSSIRRPPSTTASSHYLGTLKVLDQKPSQKQNTEPERADSIRATVYQEWLEKKNVYLHEMHRIKRIESENLRIQNEQKRAAKRKEALASFEAWKAMKEKEAKKIAARKRLEEKSKKKTEKENAARKGEALQAFEQWKEKKMEYLREKNKKEREYERAKKQKEEETIAEKRKDKLTAIEKWNERKDAFFKEKEKVKISEKRRELKRAEKKDKDKQAIDEYEKWLEKKERQERIERKQKKRHSFLENEALPPWSPPSRTVFSRVF